jgi:hypothetical protein
MFNNIAAAELYKRVCTDRLDLYIQGTRSKRAHPKVQSKDQLLARAKHLHLESPNVRDLFSPDFSVDPPESTVRDRYRAQVDPVSAYFLPMTNSLDRLTTFYRYNHDANLNTMTVNAFCDDRSVTGWLVSDYLLGLLDPKTCYVPMQDALGRLLQVCSPAHYCERQEYNPLYVGQMAAYREPLDPPTSGSGVFIVHGWITPVRAIGVDRSVIWKAAENLAYVDEVVDHVRGVASLLRDACVLGEKLVHSSDPEEKDQYERLKHRNPKITIYHSRKPRICFSNCVGGAACIEKDDWARAEQHAAEFTACLAGDVNDVTAYLEIIWKASHPGAEMYGLRRLKALG